MLVASPTGFNNVIVFAMNITISIQWSFFRPCGRASDSESEKFLFASHTSLVVSLSKTH